MYNYVITITILLLLVNGSLWYFMSTTKLIEGTGQRFSHAL